jgi:hypothetical protein
MNPAALEQALLTWLTGLSEATGTPPVFLMAETGVRVSMHTNVGSDDLPGAHPMIILGCPEDGKVVGALFTPVIMACVSTPVLSGNFDDAGTLATHRALSLLVQSWFVSENLPALSTALQAAAGCTCESWYVQPAKESRGKNSHAAPAWQMEQHVKLCLIKSS